VHAARVRDALGARRAKAKSPVKRRVFRRALAVMSALSVFVPAPADASCIEHPWTDFGARVARIGEPVQIALLAGAGVAPLVMSPTGVDQSARVFFQRDLGGTYDAEAMSVTVPYALSAAVLVGYGASVLAGDCEGSRFSSRALSAIGASFVAMGALKLVVGRTYPAAFTAPGADRLVDDGRSRQIQAFSQFGAWPSGHATATFAFAAVLRKELATRSFFIRYSGYVLATAVSFAMAYGDHHWASDILSGALLGEAFGRAFGGPLESPMQKTSVALVPMGTGVALEGAF
jgi:membrane-associated phospholipid phosphatase